MVMVSFEYFRYVAQSVQDWISDSRSLMEIEFSRVLKLILLVVIIGIGARIAIVEMGSLTLSQGGEDARCDF